MIVMIIRNDDGSSERDKNYGYDDIDDGFGDVREMMGKKRLSGY